MVILRRARFYSLCADLKSMTVLKKQSVWVCVFIQLSGCLSACVWGLWRAVFIQIFHRYCSSWICRLLYIFWEEADGIQQTPLSSVSSLCLGSLSETTSAFRDVATSSSLAFFHFIDLLLWWYYGAVIVIPWCLIYTLPLKVWDR